ncbi:RNA polymerase sigma factor [Fodinibius sediminis]|uniref:RNA polymerase sigma factor, sigma-70 family n=1 Tax=Fodinibius sediminis TaxID=1214077 RepID=A0A521BMT9_9BACT|nr:sigma-70 family RNA polymerase sigma factor [Fodinibius sediminis]SMO48467.1 RNA polymerase sigma factor, sigma-70 family [Fodinibius sediminis]
MFVHIDKPEYDRGSGTTDIDELWSHLRRGDERALSELYCVSYAWLFSYGYRIVPQEAFVKDAMQDLFLILWEKRNRINKARSVRSYLRSALRRLIFRRMRKQNNRTRRNHDYGQEHDVELRNMEELIIGFELDEERKKRLALAIRTLSKRQKEAIHLKYYDGFSNTEIAKIMDINKQSVYNHVSKAISKMQNFVQE